MRRVWGSVLLWAIYIAALLLPVAVGEDLKPNDREVFGHEALMWGSFWPGTIPWLANVTLVMGWTALLLQKPKFALWCGIAGTVLSLTAPLVYEIPLGDLRIGYFLWVLCSLMLAALSHWESRRAPSVR